MAKSGFLHFYVRISRNTDERVEFGQRIRFQDIKILRGNPVRFFITTFFDLCYLFSVYENMLLNFTGRTFLGLC